MTTPERLHELQRRRTAFVEVCDDAKARLRLLEDRFVEMLLAGEAPNRGTLTDARTQLAIAEADVAMVDRILDRWQTL